MAVSDAVRRSGSLLLRTLAASGLATAAWLACAGSASADEHHADDVAQPPDVLTVALGGLGTSPADLFDDVLPQVTGVPAVTWATAPVTTVEIPRRPAGSDSQLFAVALRPPAAAYPMAAWHAPDTLYAPDALYAPEIMYGPGVMRAPEAESYPDPDPDSAPDDDRYGYYDDDTGYSYSGHSSSGGRHSGSVSNTMPAAVYEAKVAAKAAARAAAQAALAASPAPQDATEPLTAPDRVAALPLAPLDAVSPDDGTTANAEVIRAVPTPAAPGPAPKQAPAPSAPTASSSSSADNGGGHRGGLLASLTGQPNPKPSTAWSVERRDDDRSPGSVPGLPSTSPD